MIRELQPGELDERLRHGDGPHGGAVQLLDVRDEAAFTAGRVAGRQPVPTVNVPFAEFLGDPAAAVAKLPYGKDDTLVVVSAKGGASEYVADLLVEQGFTDVYNLAGGIDAWADGHAVLTGEAVQDAAVAFIHAHRRPASEHDGQSRPITPATDDRLRGIDPGKNDGAASRGDVPPLTA